MKLKKGVPKYFAMRHAMLQKCFELGIRGEELEKLVNPMTDKTDEEKEEIAARILEELQGKSLE